MDTVITYQSTGLNKIDICTDCELMHADDWPKDPNGNEYARVSHGAHDGVCDICGDFPPANTDDWD